MASQLYFTKIYEQNWIMFCGNTDTLFAKKKVIKWIERKKCQFLLGNLIFLLNNTSSKKKKEKYSNQEGCLGSSDFKNTLDRCENV
jgi:hypothetical protein